MKFVEKNFHKYVHELVKNELSHNKTAKVIGTYYKKLNLQNKEKLFESIQSYYNSYSDVQFEGIKFESTNTSNISLGKRDFRLKGLRIHSCRRFPKPVDNINYGIDFEINNQINNHVFLGQNGSGKSSIFCALEYIYTGSIGEKKLRSSSNSNSDNDFLNYLGHFDYSPECSINTVNGDYSLKRTLHLAYKDFVNCFPENHFISDYNLYEKGKINCIGDSNDEFSFHRLIANNLGLQEYLDFTSLLKALSSYKRLKEANDRKRLLEEKLRLEESIAIRIKEIKSKAEKKTELEEGTLKDNVESDNEKTLSKIIKLRESSYNAILTSETINTLITNLENSYDNYITLSVQPSLQNEAHFLMLGLELLNHSDDCPFCNKSVLDQSKIKAEVQARLISIKSFQNAQLELDKQINNSLEAISEINDSLDVMINKLKDEIDSNKECIPLITITEKDVQKYTALVSQKTRMMNLSSNITLAKAGQIENSTLINEIISNKTDLISLVDNINEIISSISTERELVFEQIESQLKREQNIQSPKEEVAILTFEIDKAKTAITADENRIAYLAKEIERLSNIIETTSQIKDEASKLADVLERKVNELTTSTFEVIRGTITDILNDYLKDEDAHLQLSIRNEPNKNDSSITDQTIIAEVVKIEGNVVKTIPPSIYFNTFRYRLLCLMVCLSIVIVVRQQTKVNLPLVMDDIFNSSDYTSKSTFRKFIIKLLNIFKKFNGDMPLQLILFTHDELIFDCALDALADNGDLSESKSEFIHEYWLTGLREQTTFSRLLSPKEIEDEITQSKFGSYKDVSYKLSKLFLDQLIND